MQDVRDQGLKKLSVAEQERLLEQTRQAWAVLCKVITPDLETSHHYILLSSLATVAVVNR